MSYKFFKLGIFSLIFIISLFVSSFAQQNKTTPKPPGKLIDVGGYRLHINVTGKASPPVVLIAGAGDFSFDWSLVQSQVSGFVRCISYDRAGLAWSDLGPTSRTMRQEAYELRLLLRKAKIKPPFVSVGHSVGGLIARVYAADYPTEVAGMVLVDSTTEDTKLNFQGKIVRVRDAAKNRTIPDFQTLASSPPKPPTKDDLEQAEFNKQFFGPPNIRPPFDRLSLNIQLLRLWALSNLKLLAAADDFWAEELQALYEARQKNPQPLGDMPLIVMIGTKDEGTPPGIGDDEWKKLSEEKVTQKEALGNLSRNSKVIITPASGHHIQLEEPMLVVNAVRHIVSAARHGTKLGP